MLTGDHHDAAEAVARSLGIDRFEAGMLPEDKLRFVDQLVRDGRIVAMAGDGINDAPALARAHVGIAMGTGADVAMESAAITLVKGDLTGIVRARRLSREVLAISARISSSLSPTTCCACRSPPALSIRSSVSALTDARRRRDDLQLRVGDRQRPAPPPRPALTAR